MAVVLGLILVLLAELSPGPALATPPDGATLPGLGATLTWTNPAGVTQFQVQIIPYNGDGPGVNLIRDVASTYTIPPPDFAAAEPNYVMLPGMSYQWRVRTTAKTTFAPEDDPSWSAWSVRTFRTAAVSSATISLVSPLSGSSVSSLTPTLSWSNTNKAVFYYEVQVSKDPTFDTDPATATAVVYWELRHGGATTPPNSYAIPNGAPLEPDTTYYWRVRPRIQGDGVPLPWTSAASFSVRVSPPGSGPLLWPPNIGTSHFGLMDYRGGAVSFKGAWIRPHPGPFIWNRIELTPGSYDWSSVDTQVRSWQTNRVAILATIWPFAQWDQQACHANQPAASGTVFMELPNRLYAPCSQTAYTNWLTALVERYDGDGVDDMPGLSYPIRHWEIANEPEMQGPPLSGMTFFQEGPDVYLQLLRLSYSTIKKADPNAVVLPGGQAGMRAQQVSYWTPVLAGARGSFDLGNIHAVGDSATFNGPEYRKFLDQSGYANLPFWITEALVLKMSTPGQPTPTDDQQARSIFTGYALSAANGADVIFNIGAGAGGQAGGSSAAAAAAFNIMARVVGDFAAAQVVGTSAVKFTMRDGSAVYALWNDARLPSTVTGMVTVTAYTGQESQQDAAAVSGNVPMLVVVPVR